MGMSRRAPNVIRVFPRRTKATPSDEYAFVGYPPLWWPEADEVHISVTFTWDIPQAQKLADAWSAVTGLPTKIGGPAMGEPGGEFIPGMYLKDGYVITSRGCPNHCWFCSVPRREGGLRELPITEGYNVTDDNLLACSEAHVRAVFGMLKRQPERALLTGGLEAARLETWHVDLLSDLKPARTYFAYDTPHDLGPLRRAGEMLANVGLKSHEFCCYVLIGYPGDTFDQAEQRLLETIEAGFFPFAMLYRDERGACSPEWARFQRLWARPQIVGSKL